MELGLCKGNKLYDKRADAAKRDAKRSIDRAQMKVIANIIAWNLWQMDGTKYVVPGSCKEN